jgi:hypothetical protein
MRVGLPIKRLAFSNDAGDVLCIQPVQEGSNFVGLANSFLVIVVFFQTLCIDLSQLSDLLERLNLSLKHGEPFIKVEFLDDFEEVYMEIIVALVSTRMVVFQHFILVLHG